MNLFPAALRFAPRVCELALDCLDEDGGDVLRWDSVKRFFAVMDRFPEIRDPVIVVTVTGNLRAEWHESWHNRFAAEFEPAGRIVWVVFDKSSSASGACDEAEFMSTVLLLGCQTLVCIPAGSQ